MLFDNWYSLLRIAVVAPLAYAILIFAVRISGKRALAKMNAFDLVVTVALGSTLATITSRRTSFAEGALSLVMLILLQFVVAWLSRRIAFVAAAFKSTPQVLFRNGGFVRPVLMRQRVLESDVLQAVRSHGVLDMADVEAVVLESDGSFSVLRKSGPCQSSSLSDVGDESIRQRG